MRLAAALCVMLAGCGGGREQHEVTAAGDLLTTDGRLREPGWAPRQLLRWDPARVHDPARLRAWDFFTIQSDTAAVNLTLFDLGLLELAAVNVVDYSTRATTETRNLGGLLVLSDGIQDGTSSYRADASSPPQLTFTTSGEVTTVSIDIPPLFGPAATGSFTIRRRAAMPYLSLATPFADDPTDFFFEHKIPGLSAEGTLTIDGRTWTFDPARTTAIMDWGRGQWPAEATWRWAGGAGTLSGKPLAFNLGEGFGDDRHGSENIVIYDDQVTKLDRVAWTFDRTDVMLPWTLRGSGVDLTLTPQAPEVGGLNLGDKYQKVRKAYGLFAGTIRLADGRTLTVTGVPGFAEEVDLAW